MVDKHLSNLLLIIVIILSFLFSLFWGTVYGVNIFNYLALFCVGYTVNSFIVMFFKNIIEKIYIYINEKKYRENSLDFNYYREIIDNYSISNLVLCYGEVDYKDELVCIFIKLIINKKIKIVDDKVYVINEEGLDQNETMLIKLFKGIKVYQEDAAKYIYEDNIKDSLNCDLFQKGKNSNVINFFEMIINFSYFIIIFYFLLLIFFDYWCSDETYGFFLFLGLLSLISYVISFQLKSYKTITTRSDKGIEIQKKLIGLKNFLEDFSIISERSIKELGLWEYYMIYALIFNIKGNLNRDAKNLYKKYILPYM